MKISKKEFEMLVKFFKDSQKFCTKTMNLYKNRDIQEYNYWKGQRKAFKRSLIEIRLAFK